MKKRNIRLKRKIFLWAGIADLLMILGASFSLAYFTSYDSVTNRLHATVMDVALFETHCSRRIPAFRTLRILICSCS